MTAVCIIVGGEAPSSLPKAFLEKANDSVLICADSGADTALQLGLIPKVIVGDLDSISEASRAHFQRLGVKFLIHDKDKDKTDLELALEHAVTIGAKEIALLGFRGGRIDHEIGNLLLLTAKKYSQIRFALYEKSSIGHLLSESMSLEVSGKVGDIISIISVGHTALKISTSGLKWNLLNNTIPYGSSQTLSNVLADSSARIDIHSGSCFIFHLREAL